MDDEAETTDPGNRARLHNGHGEFTRNPATAQRDAQACDLKIEGYDYNQIAKRLGYANRSGAYKAVQRGLKAIVREPAEHLRTIQRERLERAHQAAERVMNRTHLAHSGGKIVTILDPDTGEEMPVIDDGPVLNAVDRITRVSKRLSELDGLDAPTRIQAVTLEQVQAEIARLEAAARDAEAEHDDDPDPDGL